ncbi:hypothetical protein ACFP81_13335 [Deinococcus lacus]|uniref:Uncharacterized protein n=1 Tax=Deinococcus lacus TaxID=392561 RepID=A0ABW1YFI9_9DEIO
MPAALGPEPFLALGLAAVRLALLGGLIGTGAALGTSRGLRPLGWGLGLAAVTAVVFSLLTGGGFLGERLAHPYMTATTLALQARWDYGWLR